MPHFLKNLFGNKNKSGSKNGAPKPKHNKKTQPDCHSDTGVAMATLTDTEDDVRRELRHGSGAVADLDGTPQASRRTFCQDVSQAESMEGRSSQRFFQERTFCQSDSQSESMEGRRNQRFHQEIRTFQSDTQPESMEERAHQRFPQYYSDTGRSETYSPENRGYSYNNTGALRQISTTSDYKSMTPSSSVASEIPSLQGNIAEGTSEGLPDLPRSLDLLDLNGQFDSVQSSEDSGFPSDYPTVIERKINTSTLEYSATAIERKLNSSTTQQLLSSSGQSRQISHSLTAPTLLQQASGNITAQTGPVIDSSRKGGLSSLSSTAETLVSTPAGFARSHTAPAIPSPSRPYGTRTPPRNSGDSKSLTAPVLSSRNSRSERESNPGPGCRQLVIPFEPPLVAGVGEGEMEGEMFPPSVLQMPVGALLKSRKRLCLMLNIEQPMVESDYTPDYMGLAEMVGFDTVEIQNFWERNPSDTLFMEWVGARDNRFQPAVLNSLVTCLERLGRQDILMECRDLILQDASDYKAQQRLKDYYTVSRLEKFDCYVNIADQDLLGIGREILNHMEGVRGLRLCLTLRDVQLGAFQFEEMATMLETRCDSKVLIVLSKNYEDSDACQFLTQFAVTLDPGSRKNKLIPLLVDEDTCIPRVLRCLAMLNYHRDLRLGFLWTRLHNAIVKS